MTNANYAKFSKRMRGIEKRHRSLSRGYVQMVERDGLLVPKTRSTLQRKFPLRGVALTMALFLGFKAFLVMQLGSATYDDRVAKLAAGSPAEQVGAWVMTADPISLWLAQQMRGLVL